MNPTFSAQGNATAALEDAVAHPGGVDPIAGGGDRSVPERDPENASTESFPEAPQFPADYTPERAQQAVAEIQGGIRRLATILSTEVSDQWDRACEAITQTTSSRERIVTLEQEAQSLLEQIKRLREEAAIARDAADLARREADLFRDNARPRSTG